MLQPQIKSYLCTIKSDSTQTIDDWLAVLNYLVIWCNSITLNNWVIKTSRPKIRILWTIWIIQPTMYNNTSNYDIVCNMAFCQVSKIAHAPGMPGTFSPWPRVSDPDMYHGTCVTHVPWYMPGSLTSGFLWSRWRRIRSRHSRRMCNPQFYVCGKRPIAFIKI